MAYNVGLHLGFWSIYGLSKPEKTQHTHINKLGNDQHILIIIPVFINRLLNDIAIRNRLKKSRTSDLLSWIKKQINNARSCLKWQNQIQQNTWCLSQPRPMWMKIQRKKNQKLFSISWQMKNIFQCTLRYQCFCNRFLKLDEYVCIFIWESK